MAEAILGTVVTLLILYVFSLEKRIKRLENGENKEA